MESLELIKPGQIVAVLADEFGGLPVDPGLGLIEDGVPNKNGAISGFLTAGSQCIVMTRLIMRPGVVAISVVASDGRMGWLYESEVEVLS